MVGSGLSNMQRSKAQEGRYGKDGGGVVKKDIWLLFQAGTIELSRDKTFYYSPQYQLGDKCFPSEGHDVSTTRGKITELVVNQHSRPQRLSVLIDQKKRWALRMMVKRTCAHAQWRKPASKQTDGSISVRYNNLFDITLCMHWIRCVVWARSKMRRSTDVLQESIFSCVLSVWRIQRKRTLYVPEPANLNCMVNLWNEFAWI